MKALTEAGVGNVRKRADPLTKEQEEKLWEAVVFARDSAEGLTYLVFFYNCKLFGLRGGDEHCELCREQFALDDDSGGKYIHFMGRASKNVKGGLRQKDLSTKDLKIYAQPKLGGRCIVEIYRHYFGFGLLMAHFIANQLV